MAKEKQEKKRFALFWRILKWIGLAVLSVLIIVGLIFEAPWKVITLLLIVLAACRILPKPAIKWFWLTVGAIVIALIIWVFLPDTGEWKPYTFDQELAAIEAKRAIPDEENAATIYNKLLKDSDPNAMSLDFLDRELDDSTRSGPWSSEDYPQIAEWLKGHQGTIETLLEVVKKEKCRFPISARIVMSNEWMIRLNATRQWAYLLSRAANNDLGEGRIDQALEKQIAILQMAEHQCQQPILIDLLVGIAIEALATKQFNTFVVAGDATDEHLSIIEKALAEIKHDWSSDLLRILEGEKLLTKNTLCNTAYEINPNSKVRFSRDPWAESRTLWKKQLESGQIQDPQTRKLLESKVHPSYLQKKLIKAKTISQWFYMPSTPQKAAKIIDASFEKYYTMAKPDYDWKKEPEEFPITSLFSTRARFNYRYLIERLVGMPGKVYYRIHDLYLRVSSDKRGGRLLIALRRYKNKTGQWPESLDDIKSLAPEEIFVDPINGDSFVYKLTEENFILYSKGKNNIDENGEYKDGADDWPIWPKKSHKTKEKKADAEQQ